MGIACVCERECGDGEWELGEGGLDGCGCVEMGWVATRCVCVCV